MTDSIAAGRAVGADRRRRGITTGATLSLLLWLAPAALASLYFVLDRSHFVFDYSEASYSPYLWAKRQAAYLHIATGMVALIVGFVQIWLGMTGNTRRLHRQLGWVYVLTVAISVVAAIAMVLRISGYFAYASGLFANAIVWALATGMAIWAIRRRRIELHRDWMIRSFLMAFAFTLARLMLPAFRAVVDVPKAPIDEIQATTAWACWVVPLIVFEVVKSARLLSR